jgi:hypothetical protein
MKHLEVGLNLTTLFVKISVHLHEITINNNVEINRQLTFLLLSREWPVNCLIYFWAN